MDKLFDDEITIKADLNNFYLDDVFKQKEYCGIYDDMMNARRNQISFLNKMLCGNGGTTGLIRYALANNKGLLVLVPNVSICKSKERDYEGNLNVCCVYSGAKQFNPEAMIVVATYDQFSNLLKKIASSGVITGDDIWQMTFWGGRTIIIDEYHKLIDDSGYREVCHKMTELISNTDTPVILMSATPHESYIKMLRKLLPERTIYNYIVQYHISKSEYKTSIEVYDVKSKELSTIFQKMKDSTSNNQVCVFYNSVSDIKKILGQIGDEMCEVLCSKDSKDKVGKYYSEEFNSKKKLHFMTSAYFTGFDIWTPVDKCVIVGAGDRDNMCLGERDIKQIVGRFRQKEGGVKMDGVKLLYMKKAINQSNYMANKNLRDNTKNDIKLLGDRWMMLSNGIKNMHDLLRTDDALRRYDMWSSFEKLEKALQEYGFDVVKNTDFLKDLELIGTKQHLSFEQAKEKLCKRIDVDFDDYPDVNELKTFMEVKGESSLMSKRTSKAYIHNWFQAYQMSKGKDLEQNKGHLYDVFGIQTFGRYNARYLRACLDFIDDEADYENLPAMMYEKMGCWCIPWKLDDKGHKQGNTWLVIATSEKGEELGYDKNGMYKTYRPSIFEDLIITSKVSYETSNNGGSIARTITLNDALKTGKISSLKGIELYDWVNEDKASRLPDIKNDKKWSNIKMFKQSKISDMYKDTDNVYRYIRAEMNSADSLVIDIDGGLRFNDFCKKYDKWTWLAYPTISNVDEENWTKFRVIIPLARTIKLEGEHNLKVLKCLRTMFCAYEDPDHQVYSFINLEDFTHLRGNRGETYDIPQEFVDCLTMCITESYDFNSRRFDKKTLNVPCHSNGTMTINEAKSLFIHALSNPEEGARHKILYPIKNRLSGDDRIIFEEWLVKVHPTYMKHWKSHKV